MNKESIIIVNIYSPKGIFESALLDELKKILVPPFIIIGDLSLKHPLLGSQKESQDASKFFDWIDDINGVLINTTKHTYKLNQYTSLLDLTIASTDIFNQTNFNVKEDLFDSDHFPVQTLSWLAHPK